MRTGVWLVGARGSVAVTSIVGAAALRAGLTEPIGCVTEHPALRGGALPGFGDLVFGVQLGCELDVSQGGNASLSSTVTGGNTFFGSGTTLGNVLLNLIPTPDINPNASINLLPGNIKTLGLGTKKLKGRVGEITVHDAHVKIDGCTGIVAVRFFTYASISTDHGDDSVNTYGDILTI